MADLSYKKLGEKIKETYIHQEDFQLNRFLQEFKEGDTYLGDFLLYIIFEKKEGKAPIFYSINSPYDTVSKTSPQQALVYEEGKLLLNIDYTAYADVRTGLMDALLLDALHITSLDGKRILYLGTGKVATESIKALKEYYPVVTSVDFINQSGDPKRFGEVAEELGISISGSSLAKLSEYDYIFCHTAATSPVLKAEHLSDIKEGAVITTFTGPETEVADEFFKTEHANTLTDWPESLTSGKDLRQALEKNYLEKENVLFLKDLFSGAPLQNAQAHYTIYRSTGTPMQNLSVLKLLLE